MATELTDPDDDGLLEFTQTIEDVDGDALSVTLELDQINGSSQSGSDRNPSWLSFTTSSSLSGGTRTVDVKIQINASELGGAGNTYTFKITADDSVSESTCMFDIDVFEPSKTLSSPFYFDNGGEQDANATEHQLDLTQIGQIQENSTDLGNPYSQPSRSEVAFYKNNDSVILMDDDFNKLWEYGGPGQVRKMAWNEDYFVFSDGQTTFQALDFSSGSQISSGATNNSEISDVGLLSNGNLFFFEVNDGFSRTTIFTERDPSDGSVINSYTPLGGEDDTANGRPLLFVDDNDDVYCAKEQKGVVYKLSAGNYGSVEWTVDLSATSGNVQSLLGSTFNNYIGVLSDGGDLYRIDKDGNEIHTDNFLSGAANKVDLFDAPGNVYVGENADIISAYGTRAIRLAEDGSRKATFEDGGGTDEFISAGVKET